MKYFTWLLGKPKPKKMLIVNMDSGHCRHILVGKEIPKGYQDLEKITKSELWFNLSSFILKSEIRCP